MKLNEQPTARQPELRSDIVLGKKSCRGNSVDVVVVVVGRVIGLLGMLFSWLLIVVRLLRQSGFAL